MSVNTDGPMLSRRRLLQCSAALTLTSLAPAVLAHSKPAAERSLRFYNLHTGERLRATYFADGGYVPEELNAINYILRDFRTDEVEPIDRALLDLLHALRRKVDSAGPFHIISGYRSPKTNAMLRNKSNGVAKRSYHMKGMAIDVCLPGCELERLRRAALSLRRGGVGYYPASGFIHVDTGRVRAW